MQQLEKVEHELQLLAEDAGSAEADVPVWDLAAELNSAPPPRPELKLNARVARTDFFGSSSTVQRDALFFATGLFSKSKPERASRADGRVLQRPSRA